MGSNLVQLGFATYLCVVAFNLYHLFVPTRCGDGTPRHLCVPPALDRGEKFDLWVYASPKKDFHAIEKLVTSDPTNPEMGNATVRLMLSAFALELGAGHEVNVPIPAAHFGTRNNGTLYAHVLVYRSTKKSLAPQGLARPTGSPLAVTTAPITKQLAYRARNYTMLLGNWTAGLGEANPADGDTALEGAAGDDGAVETATGKASAAEKTWCDAESGDEDGACGASISGGAAEEVGPGGGGGRAASAAAAAATRAVPDGEEDDEERGEPSSAYPMPEAGQLVTHIRPRLSVLVVGSPPTFPHNNLPADIGFRFVKPSSKLASKVGLLPPPPLRFPYQPPLLPPFRTPQPRVERMNEANW